MYARAKPACLGQLFGSNLYAHSLFPFTIDHGVFTLKIVADLFSKSYHTQGENKFNSNLRE